MLKKSIVLFMVFLSLLYSHPPKITASTIIKSDKEKQKHLFKTFHATPIDFMPIVKYSDILLRYGLKDENFNYCLNIINKMTEIYGQDSIAEKISYLLLARHYTHINKMEAAKQIIDYVIETTQNQRYEHYEFYKQTINFFLATYYSATNNYEKAYKIYERILIDNQYLKLSDKIDIYNQLASISNIIGNYDTSIKYTKKALSIERESKLKKYKDLVVDTFINYSQSYSLRADYARAVIVLEVLIKIYQTEYLLFFPEMRNIYTEYSSLLGRLGSWSAAKDAAKRSLLIQEKLEMKNDYISFISYMNIAKSEKKLKYYNMSKKIYIKAMDLLMEINIPKSMKEKYIEYINNQLISKELSSRTSKRKNN